MVSVADFPVAVADPTPQLTPLAILCLSTAWETTEPQTLALALALRRSGRPLTLLVAADSPLHTQAQAQQLACHPLSVRWPACAIGAAGRLGRWLHRQQIPTLLTTDCAALALAALVKRWRGAALQLVHRQLTALPEYLTWEAWWTYRQAPRVDAWLAPLLPQAQEVLARTTLDARRLWVVPPTLPPLAVLPTPAEARDLLNLPPDVPLVGLLDYGSGGPAFALEALHRLRTELGCPAELVIAGSPATPADATHWQEVRSLAQQLNLLHCLHLRPLHNTAGPSLAYQALDVGLLPVPVNASGLTLLGAAAAGCPLVSVATPDARDVLQREPAHRLFERHDLAACAQALYLTLRTHPTARRLARQTADRIRHQVAGGQQVSQLEMILHYLGRHEPTAQYIAR